VAAPATRSQERNIIHRAGFSPLRSILKCGVAGPAFAKVVVITPDAEARDRLKLRLRARVAQGLAPEALIRVTQLVFGPFVPYPVAFRVMGPDVRKLRAIADQVQAEIRSNPNMRQVTQDWGPRVPELHFVLDQDRLSLIGLTPSEAAQQLAFALSGVPGDPGP